MTKLQKQEQFIRNEFGKVMVTDRWGHFKHNKYRVKMQKISFRIEIKVGSEWKNLGTIYYKDATAGKIQYCLSRIFIKTDNQKIHQSYL